MTVTMDATVRGAFTDAELTAMMGRIDAAGDGCTARSPMTAPPTRSTPPPLSPPPAWLAAGRTTTRVLELALLTPSGAP